MQCGIGSEEFRAIMMTQRKVDKANSTDECIRAAANAALNHWCSSYDDIKQFSENMKRKQPNKIEASKEGFFKRLFGK